MVAKAAAKERIAGRTARSDCSVGINDQTINAAAASSIATACVHRGGSCRSDRMMPRTAAAARTSKPLSSRFGRINRPRAAHQASVNSNAIATMAVPCHAKGTSAMANDTPAIASVPHASQGVSSFARVKAIHQ